ncbi:CDP-alcohol phosphatidyltransferase [Roseovarius albus]|uniref:CDP-alcohol phosphatidyltransferase n=1 Tax=Roseovarius albus TaxID=1247867 RepID=A0A1X6YEX6_9RHOB|nr:CDP-alcohol phosphatidyltransferase family protein [Roseovarius albus]SLN19311.1 CDP-alcohol phosphatidyltransferase [Roseovarius albus]
MTDRRPIASRGSGWARALTKWLAARDISSNQISIASMGAAGLAGLCFYFGASAGGFGGALLLVAAALFCQLRLICNLMDGLVAVEAQKGTPDGAFWNEAPDRVSDVLIFIGLGYGLGLVGLGWAAAVMTVSTAYVRELGHNITGENDFCGPMAKPHRMALVTGTAVLAAVLPNWGLLQLALWVVVIGAAVTVVRRSLRILQRLGQR